MLPRAQLLSLATRAKARGGLDLALRYNPLTRSLVQRAIGDFRRANRVERERLAARQLARVLESARRTAYGRGRPARIQDWPILQPSELRDAPELFCRQTFLRVPASTSGTTGRPLRLWRSMSSITAEQAFLDLMLEPYGLSWASARVASMRPHATKPIDDWEPPFAVETHRGCRLILSSPHLTRATFSWFIDRLARFRPSVLWITPTVLANLLGLREATGHAFPRPAPIIMTSSACLSPGLREAIEADWGATIIDYYGQAERACLASGTSAGAFRFEPAYGNVELMPVGRDDLPRGCWSAAIVATGYWNPAMPLVRYDTGDSAILGPGADPAAVALGLEPFLGLAGRTDEFLLTPEGTRLGGLNCLPWELENVLQMQIVQEALDLVVVRLLVRPGFREADRRRTEANVRTKVPYSMGVRLEIVDRLETTAAGKTPFVLRRICPVSESRPKALSPPDECSFRPAPTASRKPHNAE